MVKEYDKNNVNKKRKIDDDNKKVKKKIYKIKKINLKKKLKQKKIKKQKTKSFGNIRLVVQGDEFHFEVKKLKKWIMLGDLNDVNESLKEFLEENK